MDLSPVALLLDLRRRGVRLIAKGDRLGFPPGSLGPEDMEAVREAKPVLLALLRAERENEPIPSRPCSPNRTGEHRRFWFGVYRSWKCGECHPPGSSGLVLTWHVIGRKAAVVQPGVHRRAESGGLAHS